MTATMTAQPAPPEFLAHSLWERRMLRRTIPSRIRSDFPDIGRGNVDHDTVPHRAVERGLGRCARLSILERLLAFFDF